MTPFQLIRFQFVCFLTLCLLGGSAWAVDYDEYSRLVERANALIDATTDDAALTGLRERAIEADLAVLDWLQAFMASEEFGTLGADGQAAVMSDDYRWEYNLSVQLIAVERCQEASDRLGGLLDEALADEALMANLATSYGESLSCVSRLTAPEVVRVRIEVSTPGAEVAVDGTNHGLAPVEIELPSGSHEARVTAVGFVTRIVAFDAAPPSTDVGPITLEPVVVEPVSKSPNATEWALWGVGAAGIGVGTWAFIVGSDWSRTMDDAIAAGDSVQNLADERARVRTLNKVAGISAGIGFAAAITGIVLYITRDPEPAGSIDVSWFADFGGVGLRF